MLYNVFAKYFGRGVCIMKTYTEPKLEIVTLNASDVITTSGFMSLMSLDSGIENGTSVEAFNID